MKIMFKKILAAAVLFGLVTMSGLVSIILCPSPLFANKLVHGQFDVYSSGEVDAGIREILDRAEGLIKHSELYDPEDRFDVYLSYNTWFNAIDDAVMGHGPSARATNNYVTFKVAVDINRDLFFPTFYQKCEGNLTYLLAHELIHVLQESRYGKLMFNPFSHPEHWKLEGYPEYIARRPARLEDDYSLAREIDRYLELESKSDDMWLPVEEGKCMAPSYYYKGRLMIEYLMDIKKMSYDQILSDVTSEQTIFNEMIEWRDEKKRPL